MSSYITIQPSMFTSHAVLIHLYDKNKIGPYFIEFASLTYCINYLFSMCVNKNVARRFYLKHASQEKLTRPVDRFYFKNFSFI